jgi:hypothetical protein
MKSKTDVALRRLSGYVSALESLVAVIVDCSDNKEEILLHFEQTESRVKDLLTFEDIAEDQLEAFEYGAARLSKLLRVGEFRR